jgi:hypothetical protein
MAEDSGKSGSEAVWLTLYVGSAGGPSLRLKNGCAQDDNRNKANCATADHAIC